MTGMSGVVLYKMGDPFIEPGQSLRFTTAPFRKEDQDFSLFQSQVNGCQRIFSFLLPLTLQWQDADHIEGKPGQQAITQEVVHSGDRLHLRQQF